MEQNTIREMIAAWGHWPLFVGLAVALLVRGWLVARPLVIERVPSRYRPLVAIVAAGLTSGSAALVGGADWIDAISAAATAWATAAAATEGLRLAFGKPASPTADAPPAHVVIPPVAMVLLVAIGIPGCAPSLERAHAAAPPRLDGATQVDPGRCQRLSNREQALRYVAVGAATLGGGTGLTTIPADDPAADLALAITAGSFAVVAVTAESLRSEAAADWARECQ